MVAWNRIDIERHGGQGLVIVLFCDADVFGFVIVVEYYVPPNVIDFPPIRSAFADHPDSKKNDS